MEAIGETILCQDHANHILQNAKNNLKIAVIYSGQKKDPGKVIRQNWTTRSWKSYQIVAEDIADSLRGLGFLNVTVLAEGLDLIAKLAAEKIDLVWINSGGVQGVNPVSHLPSLLEMAGIPYVGHNPTNATVLDNKHLLKWGMSAKSLPTAPFFVWNSLQTKFKGIAHEKFQRNFGDYSGPFIVKPVNGRGSVLVEYVESAEELPDVINHISKASHNAVMVEKYLSGDEFTVAVMPPFINRANTIENLDSPVTFSYTRRNLDADEKVFTSMDVKPMTASRFTVLNPQDDAAVIEKLSTLAKQVYTSFNLETLVRIDCRMGEDGQVYVLEANPKPDLKRPSAHSTNLACCGLDQLNMTYDDLILSLMTSTLLRLDAQVEMER